MFKMIFKIFALMALAHCVAPAHGEQRYVLPGHVLPAARVKPVPQRMRPDFREMLALYRYGAPAFPKMLQTIAAGPFNAYSVGTLGGNCAVQGSLLFQSTSGISKCLGAGTAGQVIQSGGPAADIVWGTDPATVSIGIGTTNITGGTTTRVLFDNAGVVGEYTVSGTGNVAMTTNGVFTTPNLGTPSALNLANSTNLPIGAVAANLIPNANLAQAAAKTLKGNPTVSTANVSDFAISSLTDVSTPNTTLDWIPIEHNATGTIQKVNPSELALTLGAGVSSFNGRTGAITPQASDYNTLLVASFNARTGAVVPTVGDYTTQQLTPLSSGTAPAVSKLGHLCAQTIGSSSGITPATGAVGNIVSCVLPAGSYECSGNIGFNLATATTAALVGWITTTSGVNPNGPNAGAFAADLHIYTAVSATPIFAVGTVYFDFSTTTTVYLEGQVNYSAGSVQLYGALNCNVRA
jgi:hypothetical protein